MKITGYILPRCLDDLIQGKPVYIMADNTPALFKIELDIVDKYGVAYNIIETGTAFIKVKKADPI